MGPALRRVTLAVDEVAVAEGAGVGDMVTLVTLAVAVSVAVAVAVVEVVALVLIWILVLRVAVPQTPTRTRRQRTRWAGLEIRAEVPGAPRRLPRPGSCTELRHLVGLRGRKVRRRRPVGRVAEVARI